MKRFFIRTLKILSITFSVVLLSAFIWANWEKPGPGMRAPVVDFVQYDLANLTDSKTKVLENVLLASTGIQGVTYNSTSKILVVSYRVNETSRVDFENETATKCNYQLREKKFIKTGPKCPIDVAWISRIKKTLCVRD